MGRFGLTGTDNDNDNKDDQSFDDDEDEDDPMEIVSIVSVEDQGGNDHGNRRNGWEFFKGNLQTRNCQSYESSLQHQQPTDDTDLILRQELQHPQLHHQQQQQQPIYFIIQDGREMDLVQRQPTRRRLGCSLWCRSLLGIIFSVLIYYIVTHGPPGPPPQQFDSLACLHSFLGDKGANGEESRNDECQWNVQGQARLETWNDYTQKHNAALMTVFRAYFVDTLWHVVSWTLPHILYDASSAFIATQQHWKKMTKPRTCVWAKASPPGDLYAQIVERVPTAASQPHAILPLVQRLETTVWSQAGKQNSPLVFWASVQTPGLAVAEIAEQVVELVLADCPATSPRPFASLDMASLIARVSQKDEISNDAAADRAALEFVNRILRKTNDWNGGGGVFVLEHVDKIQPLVLHRLILALTRDQDHDDGDSISIAFEGTSALQNIAFLLVSETIGKPSMGRHFRRSGSVEQVALSSLLLDIEHEISTHLSSSHSHINAQVLPFWLQSRDDLEVAISSYLDHNFARSQMGWKHLHIQSTMIDEMLSDQRVEFVRWTIDDNRDPVQFSTNGFAPVSHQMRILETKLKSHCSNEMEQATACTLSYEKTSRAVVLQQDRGESDTDEIPPSTICRVVF
mmetsp:Transcript_15124/g.34481  ORF Transcript_15124/g.34481 Transcript_15124/m.34481 type:complete len:627 (+) Transcript_15124:2-1882(+)